MSTNLPCIVCYQNKGIKCFQQTSNQTNKFATNIIWHHTPQFSPFIGRFVNRAHNYNRIRFQCAFHLSDWIGIYVYCCCCCFFLFFPFIFVCDSSFFSSPKVCSLLHIVGVLFLYIFIARFFRYHRWQIRLTFGETTYCVYKTYLWVGSFVKCIALWLW